MLRYTLDLNEEEFSREGIFLCKLDHFINLQTGNADQLMTEMHLLLLRDVVNDDGLRC